MKTPDRPHSAETHRALEAADGYLFLGMPLDALEQFKEIPEEEIHNPEVMLAMGRIILHTKDWKSALKLAKKGVEIHPSEDEFVVQKAFALHQLEKDEEAYQVIRSAPEWIRRTGIIHYNLACYEARFGDLNMARRCIDVAIRINSEIKKKAKTDPDLKAL